MKRMIATIAAVAAFATTAFGQAQERTQSDRRIFESEGIPTAADADDQNSLFLSFWDEHVRFHVASQPGERLARLDMILRRSVESGRSLKYRFDAGQGRVNSNKGTLDFPLCELRIDDLKFEPVLPCSAATISSPPSGEAALALGYAHSNAGEHRRALELLERAGSNTDPAFHALLLRIRSDAAIRSIEQPWSESADRAFLAALKDYRALATIQPENVELQFFIASALEELGDYDEARIVLDRIPKRWPDEKFRVAVRIAAIYRRQGENMRALEQLDRFAASSPSSEFEGMKFHYHRGWALVRLGRFDEAVSEFDAGLQRQPDYAYAYFRRACAQASRARLADALSDMERGRKLLAEVPSADATLAFDLRRADAVIQDLKKARATRGDVPMPEACNGYWGRYDEVRTKSRLLSSG
jgi:tetratricopeptide (TPR) repeat protein